MIDREKVISHLRIINIWAKTGREKRYITIEPSDYQNIEWWTADALKLIEELEERVTRR